MSFSVFGSYKRFPKLKFNLFADDSMLSHKHVVTHDIANVERDIEREACSVYAWLCSNKIQVNVNRTQFMIFSYRKVSYSCTQVRSYYYQPN